MNHCLRSGFTTGTCAAVAAKAAAVLLITGEKEDYIELMTPGGKKASMKILEHRMEKGRAGCCVEKDSGDDPDVTHQSRIWAWVQLQPAVAGGEKQENLSGRERWYASEKYSFLYLTGGGGIGLVTRPGLSCPVGKHAINPVPRQMIFQSVAEVCLECGWSRPLLITVEIPGGEMLAAKTFNPRLGISGGLSVLGTSGIVKPMSQEALLETIRLELHMKAVSGQKRLILTPGNYGEAFVKEQLHLSLEEGIICSNFIFDSLMYAAAEGFREILLVGHMGKLIKVAGGVKNTHSMYGDRRMEILAACCKAAGVTDEKLLNVIEGSNTTEEAAKHLEKAGLTETVMAEVMSRIQAQAREWTSHQMEIEVVTFSSSYGILGMTKNAGEMAERFLEADR